MMCWRLGSNWLFFYEIMITRFALLMLSFFMASCDVKELAATNDQVMGSYVGKLPSGQIELWQLDADGVFTQKFFSNEAKFLANKPEHLFTSTWRIGNQRLVIAQTVEHFDLHPPFQVKKPETISWNSPILWMSSGFGSDVPIIVMSEDEGVIFQRGKGQRNEIRVFGWRQ
jgi:hypothetical protein